MKSRALFVDDEPLVLSGLRRMLRSLRHDWDMSFANSGKEALELLDEGDFAVIVSDMRMPEMDGAFLLNAVAARHPAVARLVLSGHAELDAILRAVRPAHQFLAKPCDPKLLEGALRYIREASHDRETNALRTKLGTHRRLPSPSVTIDALRAALVETPADLATIGRIVSNDIAMSIQLLRLVNSAVFGPPIKTLDPHRAVSILGADILSKLLDQVRLFRPVEGPLDRGEATVVALNHQARTAAAALDDDIDARTRAVLTFAGPLAALETTEPLEGGGEQGLGRLLLAYWGFEVDFGVRPAASGAERHAELEGVQ